jgi:hypothetical protein
VVLTSSETREKGRGTARSTTTSTLAVDDLLDDLELPGRFFFSARRRRAPAGEKEVERGQMRGRGEFQRGGSAFNCQSEPGLWCTTSETIGRRWRCLLRGDGARKLLWRVDDVEQTSLCVVIDQPVGNPKRKV